MKMNVGSIHKGNPLNHWNLIHMACGISCCRMAGSSSLRDSTYLEEWKNLDVEPKIGGF